MRIFQISKIIVASIFLWAAAIAWMNDPGPATGLAAAENVNASAPVVSSQCTSSYCVTIPFLAKRSITELDPPLCRWPYYPGQMLYLSYKWGVDIAPGTPWRIAFEDGLQSWNWTLTPIWYYYDANSDNVIQTIFDENESALGKTIWIQGMPGCVNLMWEMWGNRYWDNFYGYTSAQRRGIAAHEVGHGVGIGHIPQSYPIPPLMIVQTDPEHPITYWYYSAINVPQPPDIALVNRIYP